MASCKLMHAFCLALLMLLLASVAASATRGCANQKQQWRQQLRACDDYMRQSRQDEAGGCRANPRRDQPSQQCCQNLQRISSRDRCRALREVYGGRQQGVNMDAFADLQMSMQQRASRLLQQCNLRPGDCSDRSRDEGFIVNEVDEFVWRKGISSIFRWGFPGKNRRIQIRLVLGDVEAVGLRNQEGLFPSRILYLKVRSRQSIPLTRGENSTPEYMEEKAAELARFLRVSIEGF
ncbi:hypothetical protein L7F22_032064 [Adiantum nelumboides]|nr:hypothetical protein [Adiantum nelumboides]